MDLRGIFSRFLGSQRFRSGPNPALLNSQQKMEPDTPVQVDMRNFYMPWEHRVCSKCLDTNPYAIWLVKVGCFKPHVHNTALFVTVMIEHERMRMIFISALPSSCISQKDDVVEMCKTSECKGVATCGLAHSAYEFDTWNTKKCLIDTDLSGVSVIVTANLPTQSPSQVCQMCLERNPNAVWLSWLKCVSPSEHSTCPSVTVVANAANKRLVRVRQLPSSLNAISQVQWCKRDYCRGPCTKVHSIEEMHYWKWQLAIAFFKQNDSQFLDLYTSYNYPDELSPCFVESLQLNTPLTSENYKSKYHKLVYLEEMEGSRRLVQECDSSAVELVLDYFQMAQDESITQPTVYLKGLSTIAIDHASANKCSAVVTLQLPGGRTPVYSADVGNTPDYEREALVLTFGTTSSFFYHFSPDEITSCLASVHFEISHGHTHTLHKIIDSASSIVLKKLFPEYPLSQCLCPIKVKSTIVGTVKLDEKYQKKALHKILTCSPSAPFLLLGPFGTGKTYLLAAGVVKVIEEDRNCNILVCTHRNRCANSLCQYIQANMGIEDTRDYIVRVVPSEEKQEVAARKLPNIKVMLPSDPALYEDWPVIVTTFTTAFHFLPQRDFFSFTHIFVDEGAQCSEPETLGALVLAKSFTKVIVVGDNKQVGPCVSVISDKARENGLGTSLLERLYDHYANNGHLTETHTATLLTNYRCHPSILMMASSLFYEHTLVSRSTSEAHPKAPYPLVMLCTSFEEKGFKNLPAENIEEATLLVSKMVEFIQSWPRDKLQQPIGLLASTKQQVACLRHLWRRHRYRLSYHEQSVPVEIMRTYNIQGEEFSAVFLSTCEPTDSLGMPGNPINSICNEYVFNTVVTRARSLIYVAGNPFQLIHMGRDCRINCWIEFIRRCIQCESLIVNEKLLQATSGCSFHLKFETLYKKVGIVKSIMEAADQDCEEIDAIIERYIDDLQKRKDYKIAKNLVQGPTGDLSWVDEETSGDGHKDSRNIVWCRLDCKDFRNVTATPVNRPGRKLQLTGLTKRRCGFQGDVVRVDLKNKCVLLDEETESAIHNTHFGESFICRVSPQNPTMFFPIDNRYPKFVNLPTLAKDQNATNEVVCFDPRSINSIPKVSDFIPMECAVKMVFVVKFLGWKKGALYPLGIIVGALPSSQSSLAANLLLKLTHSVPPASFPDFNPVPVKKDSDSPVEYKDAFTIDSLGANDRDDALTCRLTSNDAKKNLQTYEIGVHIVDVQRHVPKDSELDKIALQRGCSFYRNASDCVSSMLPPQMVENTLSFSPGAVRRTQSVLTQFKIHNGRVEQLLRPKFVECRVQSSLCLTYEEAEQFLCNELVSPPSFNLDIKKNRYNSQLPCGPQLKTKLQVLWQVAMFLRKRRLGTDGAYCYRQRGDAEHCPEAHHLVEEFMIWANSKVSERVMRAYPTCTVVRVQAKPDKEKLEQIIRDHSNVMSTSLSLKALLPKSSLTEVKDVTTLKLTCDRIKMCLDQGFARYACYQIQFEHHHPMTAIVTTKLKMASSASNYTRTDKAKRDYWHDGLCVKQYSHFTSPIRRYGDIVMQRLLHSALHGLPCPYQTTQEMDEICSAITNSLRCSNGYDRSVRKLDLSLSLQLSSRQVKACVMKADKGNVRFVFLDLQTSELSQSESQISVKHLKADTVPSTWNSEDPYKQDLHRQRGAVTHFSWHAKVASFTNNLTKTFSHGHLELDTSPSTQTERYASVSVFYPDSAAGGQESSLTERKLAVKIIPLTTTVPRAQWNSLLEIVKNDIQKTTISSLTKQLPISNPPSSSTLSMPRESSVYVFTVNRRLNEGEVLHVQLAASYQSNHQLLSPFVQLVEVAPELRVCTQHASSPTKCFTDKLTKNASRQKYASLHKYFTMWQPVLLAEAAVTSVADSEVLLIKDVQLKWPRLDPQLDSSGNTIYTLPQSISDTNAGVRLDFPEKFINLSYDFFQFTNGDFVCVRYDVVSESGADVCRAVYHMVVHKVEKREMTLRARRVLRAVTVYLRFVTKSMNRISETMAKVLMGMSLPNKKKLVIKCELQLIPLTLPFRRVYRSLYELTFEESTSPEHSLAEKVALGLAKTANFNDPPNISSFLAGEQLSIATSLWPLTRRNERGRGGLKKLNKFQKAAVDLACSNQFTLIQGPPGTGKSVTGAHIAYALAIKLKQQKTSGDRGPSREVRTAANEMVTIKKRTPCVLYCAPSNHAVNVVLDMLTGPNSPAKKELKIVRVFGKLIEENEYCGPKFHRQLFHKNSSPEGKCLPHHKEYALHKIVRRVEPDILAYDHQFARLERQGKIPSQVDREKYRSLLFKTEKRVLSEGADIVLCTCNEASSHRLVNSIKPVYCIIDECAMATEPECMVPICNAENIVLIGDHKQLNPVIKNKEAEEMGLGTSLFFRYVTKPRGNIPKSALQEPYMLKMQYRMHPELCAFPSREFYRGQLLTDHSIVSRRKPETTLTFWPCGPAKPFVFIDMVGEEKKFSSGQKGNVSLDSKFNPKEADKIAEVIEVLMRQYRVTAESLAVLTPYSAQKDEISKKLKHKRIENIPVKTITESQGSEYGIILLSTVRSRKIEDITNARHQRLPADIGWIRSNLGFVTDRNRICVGITRAKYGLIIVGNSVLLSYDDTWRRLIDHYRENRCVCEGSSFPPQPRRRGGQ